MIVDIVSPRLAAVRNLLRDLGADAYLVSHPDNRRYLSGFTGSAGALLIAVHHAFIATDFRYFEQAGLEAPGFELAKVTAQLGDVLPDLMARAGVQRLAFEADHVTVADMRTWMQATNGIEWIPTQGKLIDLRAIKDEAEIALVRKAIAVGDSALAAALAGARPGMTERELAWAIETQIRTLGGESTAFELIVACGSNGARPHARATDAHLVAGEPIVIDMGATVGGYRSDLTRTVCFGPPRDAKRFWQVYNTVLKAQMAVEAALRPGMTGVEADAVARDFISDAGFGEYFGHGLGHGVGLADSRAAPARPPISRYTRAGTHSHS
jgi:Xaa-Pro aminopeptidase